MSAPLSELVDLISTELGVYDSTSIDLIKSYLNANYSAIWDKYPWKDTQQIYAVDVAAGSPTPPYPATLDRAITVAAVNNVTSVPFSQSYRSDMRFLDPVDPTFLLETNPDIIYQSGFTIYYQDYSIFSGKVLRLYPIPATDMQLLIVGKVKCPGFVADTSVSLIRNIDLALRAYATSDMLKRLRQYGKADLRRKEAQELEAVAWNLEQQQANQPRMTKATTVAGNSLAEMTDGVCAICGQWTPEYRLIIREFLRRNYQTMYDTFLWPESLVMVRVPYSTEQVVLPEYIDKVLGVRGTNDLRMFPADAGLILDITPSSFDEIGDPISYTTLTPIGVATLPVVTTKLVIASTSPVDTSMMAIRGEITSVGQQFEESVQLNGTTPVSTVFSYDIPLTAAKDITIGTVTVNAESDSRLLVELLPYQRESKYQRLWFLPAPNSDNLPASGAFTCLVLGKRAIRPLLTDQDTPIITGVQQVLIAAAAADLFRKLEKHDLANAMLQKAAGATDVLKAKNTDQAASAPRFVPQVEPRAYVAGCTW